MNRRKTKTERELVADINKTYAVMCSKNACISCEYKNNEYSDCRVAYIAALLNKKGE